MKRTPRDLENESNDEEIYSPADEEAFLQAEQRCRERRRNRWRKRARRLGWRNLMFLLVAAGASLVFSAMIVNSYADYRFFQARVHASEQNLASLEKQFQLAENRLARLNGDKGKMEILVERGYVKPGDRILLFPSSADHLRKRNAAIMSNDLAPHPAMENRPTGSAWQRAARSISDWWEGVRKAPAPSDGESSATDSTREDEGSESSSSANASSGDSSPESSASPTASSTAASPQIGSDVTATDEGSASSSGSAASPTASSGETATGNATPTPEVTGSGLHL